VQIVVTGGAGFIGRHVLRELAGRGHDVTAVDTAAPPGLRDTALRDIGFQDISFRDIEVRRADVRDLAPVTEAVEGADAVIHLAAKVGLGVDIDDMDDYVSTNSVGTAVLLRAMARAGVRRLVQASSMVVYGEGRYDCPEHGTVQPAPRTAAALTAGRFEPGCPRCGAELTPGLVGEDAPLDPRNTYAATKALQEQLAAVWVRETGARAVSLRLHNVFGPGMPKGTPYAGVAAIFAAALDRGEAPRVFEDGRQRRDFVHVSDIARAFATAVEQGGVDPTTGHTVEPEGEHRAYNVGSGVVSTVGDMARALGATRGGPEAVTPVVTGEFRLGDVRHITASSARIATDLGFRAQVSLEDGLRGLVFS